MLSNNGGKTEESRSWTTSEKVIRNDLAAVHRLSAFYGMDQLQLKQLSGRILTYQDKEMKYFITPQK